MHDITARLYLIIANSLKVAVEHISATTTLGDLGADSLDTIAIILAIEDEFGIKIPDESLGKIQTIHDLHNQVCMQLPSLD